MPNTTKRLLIFESRALRKELELLFTEVLNEPTLPDRSSDQVADLVDQLSVADAKSCSTCGVKFDSVSDQREHFKLDWHRYNVSSKVNGVKAVTEEEFNQMVEKGGLEDDQVSLSGSESDESSSNDESGDDEDEDDSNSRLKAKLERQPKVYYVHKDSKQVYSLHNAVSHEFDDVGTNPVRWAVIMLGGGHFAGAIFEDMKAVVHKTFHSYTVRKKQGGSQSFADNKSGSSHPKSAGASLRRYNEASHAQHIHDFLKQWKPQLDSCSRIFFRAASGNRKILFGKTKGGDSFLWKGDERVFSIPFPTRRATFKEVKRVHETLMTIEVHQKSVDEVTNQILGQISGDSDNSKRSPQKKKQGSKKNSNIHRSKSRDVPNRDISDHLKNNIVDSSDDANDEIPDVELVVSEVTSTTDHLKEFDSTPVPKKSKKKKKASDNQDNIGKIDEKSQQLQNSLVTACKTGDSSLLNLLLEGVDRSKKELNKTYGNSQSTLLHIAAQEGHGKIIAILLENNCDPTAKDKSKKVPYFYCPDKESRNAFRRFQASHLEKWDYVAAGLPKGQLLTPEEEARQAAKKAEKRKAAKAARKTRESEQKEVEKAKKAEEEERQRFLNLSDREKRALAAEKRLLAASTTDPASPSTTGSISKQRCFQCAADITGKVPFEYADYKFCKPACVKEHRQKNK